MGITPTSGAPRDIAGQPVAGAAAEIARRDVDQSYTAARQLLGANGTSTPATSGMVAITQVSVLPPAGAAYRARLYQLLAPNTDDALYVCTRKSDGSYTWTAIT